MLIEELSFLDLGDLDLDSSRLKRTLKSATTAKARVGEDVRDIAKRIAHHDVDLIFTMSGDNPIGVLVLTDLYRNASALGVQGADFRSIVDDIDAKQGEEIHRVMRSIRRARPVLYWCSPGQHYTSQNPCRINHE